jgi:hypothetical protein
LIDSIYTRKLFARSIDDPYKTPVEDLSPDQATPIGVNRGTSTPLDALIPQQALQRCGGDFE